MSNALDAIISRVRALRDVATEAAKEAAPLVEAAVKSTATAGTSPSGQAWAPKKEGGRRLVHAADAVSASTKGVTVSVKLTGPEVFHQFSKGGRLPKSEIIPTYGEALPTRVAEACAEGAKRAFVRLSGGR